MKTPCCSRFLFAGRAAPPSLFVLVGLLSLASCRQAEGLEPVAILVSLVTGLPRPVQVDQPTLTVSGLEWERCTFGQEFRYGIGDCKGAGDSENDYGATPVSFCSSDDAACNDADGLLDTPTGEARSELYYACHGAITAGKSGWRVPGVDELKSLVQCAAGTAPLDSAKGCGTPGDLALIDLALFATTVPGDYWTAEASGVRTAHSVSFGRGYVDDSAYKSFKKYVRCVRNPS